MNARLERRALIFGGAMHGVEMLLRRDDDIAQHIDTARRGFAKIDGGDTGDRERFGQLRALVFDMDGEIFLIGAQESAAETSPARCCDRPSSTLRT